MGLPPRWRQKVPLANSDIGRTLTEEDAILHDGGDWLVQYLLARLSGDRLQMPDYRVVATKFGS
jgi:hypothetical protein